MATVRHRIGSVDHGRRMTLVDFREAEEQPGYLYELARGVLEVSEVPGDALWQILDNLHEMFSLYRRLNPGLILRIGHGSEVRFVIPELRSDRLPDLTLLFRGAAMDERGRLRAGLAVEVVSPGGEARLRDYEVKREEYLSIGLGEYWIVDPMLRRIVLLTRREQAGVATWTEQAFVGDDLIASELLPGFQGTVADLWADVEESD